MKTSTFRAKAVWLGILTLMLASMACVYTDTAQEDAIDMIEREVDLQDVARFDMDGTLTIPDEEGMGTVQTNKLTLAVPLSSGGSVYGTVDYTIDIDLTCDTRNTYAAKLTGGYDPTTRRLGGELSGSLTEGDLSGCEGRDFTPVTFTGTWEGEFDPVTTTITGTITIRDEDEPDEEPLVVTFEAHAPEYISP